MSTNTAGTAEERALQQPLRLNAASQGRRDKGCREVSNPNNEGETSMLRHLVLWRGYIFPERWSVRRTDNGEVHTTKEWASYRRSLTRTTPFHPTYHS